MFSIQPSIAEGEDFEINHADNLEILPDRIVLTGSVSVSSKGKDKFTLSTNKLVSIKDAAGQYSVIETFGRSSIVSEKFSLKADKLFFRKTAKSTSFDLLDASGSIDINSKDGSQKVKAPKVKIALDKKKLYATEGVETEQIVEDKDKKQVVTITSKEQDIDLLDDPLENKAVLRRQLVARESVVTKLEDATVNSDYAELYTLNGKGEKAIFTGNANLVTSDKTTATGKVINYFLNTKLLVIESGDERANLVRGDGTDIVGDTIKYNSENKTLFVESKPGAENVVLTKQDGTKISGNNIQYNSDGGTLQVDSKKNVTSSQQAVLKVPYTEKDGSIIQMIIKADSIENKELNPGETLLTAKNIKENKLVELEYGLRKGWGKELFISQNTNIPEKKADSLILIGNAKMIDYEKDQILEGPVIQIGLGEKDLLSGLTGRSSGFIPIESKKDKQKNTKSKTTKKTSTVNKTKTTSKEKTAPTSKK